MPSPAELVGELVGFVGDVLGSSSLRFAPGPTIVLLGVMLVFLQLVARPISRWVSADPAGLAGVGRAMALAAESGTDAVVSLGTGGIARATDAVSRLQTLAALPVLAHIVRASARAGVPLRVLTNDAFAGTVAAATLDAAQRSHIEAALVRTGWVIDGNRGAAKILGMHPNTLRSRMKKLGIERP